MGRLLRYMNCCFFLVYSLQPATAGDSGEEDGDATPQSIDRGPNPEACRYMNECLARPVGEATVLMFVGGPDLMALWKAGDGVVVG